MTKAPTLSILSPRDMLQAVSKLAAPCVIVDARVPGVRLSHAMQEMTTAGLLVIDLKLQAPRLRWDSQWSHFSFGPLIDRTFIPAEAVTDAIDSVAPYTILTARRPH